LEQSKRNTADAAPEGLTVVLGPPNSGKMGYLLAWWQERLQSRPVLVAPTYLAALDLSMEMARRVGALVGAPAAMTFDGLVRTMLGRPVKYVNELERLLVAARLLARERLSVLEPVAELPGTLLGLAALLEELDDSDHDSEGIKRALAAWAAADPASAELAGDLSRLHEAYVEFCLSLGLTSRARAARQAASRAAGWERPVGFYGFTSFTPAQRELIEALARQVEVVVVLPHDDSREVSLCASAEIAWWIRRARRLVCKSREERAYSSPAIAYLERHFASKQLPVEPPPASSAVEGVSFVLCSGRRAELEAAAERIAELVNQGFHFSDIAVLVRSLGEWRASIREVFDSCRIPYQVDEQLVVRETGLGHAFLALLRGLADGQGSNLLGYLRTPYSGIAADQVCELERHFLTQRSGGIGSLLDIAAKMGLVGLEDLTKLAYAEGEVGSGEKGVLRLDLGAAQVVVRRMLACGLHGSSQALGIDEDVRVYLAVHGLLEALALLPEEFRDLRLILRVLPSLPVPSRRAEHSDAVQVMTVSRARARRFGVVFMLGLVEGEFPRQGNLVSLLSSRQRSELDQAAGGGLFEEEQDREEALFLNGVSRAWQVLVLSAREVDDDGSKVEVSRFWFEARRLLGADERSPQKRGLADQVFAPEKAPCLREYLRACVATGRLPHPAVARAAGFHMRWSDLAWTQPPHRLTAPVALEELRSLECFTPSSLEAFSRCPFAWFIERVVGVEEFATEVDMRVLGELLHRALSRIYRELSRQKLLPLTPENLARAQEFAETALTNLLEEETLVATLAERRLLGARLRVLVSSLLRMEAVRGTSLQVEATEKSVGGKEGVDIGGLRVRGRIDRVDTTDAGTAAFVLDYKSGSLPEASKLGTADDLQLALYLLALEAADPHREIIGGAYVSPRDKQYVGVVRGGWQDLLGDSCAGLKVLDEDEWRSFLEKACGVAVVAADGIRSGVISPRPHGKCPEWCDLGPVCRSERKERRR